MVVDICKPGSLSLTLRNPYDRRRNWFSKIKAYVNTTQLINIKISFKRCLKSIFLANVKRAELPQSPCWARVLHTLSPSRTAHVLAFLFLLPWHPNPHPSQASDFVLKATCRFSMCFLLPVSGLFHFAWYSPGSSVSPINHRSLCQGWTIFYCVYTWHVFPICSVFDRHLGCFHIVDIVRKGFSERGRADILVGWWFHFSWVCAQKEDC